MLKTRLNGTVRPEMDAGLRRGIAAAAVLLIVCVLAVGVVSADTVTVSSFGELESNIIGASGDRTIIVNASFPFTSQLPIDSGNITLTTDGLDHTLSRNCGGDLFTVNFGGSLTITGSGNSNLTLDGMGQDSSSLVMVSGGTFTLADGGILTNNTASYNGGGVCVNSGTFTMSGGTISDNTANNGYGGGVYLQGGTFTMSGGTISDNTANNGYGGGGVYVNSGTFTMFDDAVISGNTAGKGGGVYVNSGTFTMSGDAVISGNTADDGGGVYVSNTFTMSGDAVISGNTAGKGGGVYMLRGTFELFSGTISSNTASNNGYGGGVYVNSGTFTMSDDAVISSNTAGYGGGVYVTGKFEMSGNAVISGNTADDGGGVYMLRGKFELSGSGSTDSVYLGSGKSITVTGELTGTDNQVTGIELADLDDGTRVVTFENTVSDPKNYVPYFTLSSSVGQNVLTYNAQSLSLVLTSAWKVTFDTTGGTPGTYDVLVAKDTPVTEPAAPTMTGHTFTGWYNESSCVNPWDFNTPVTGDITLYAGWKKDELEPGPGPDPDPTPVPPSGGSSGDGNMENAFRVLFNDGATTLTVQTDLSYGDKLTKPEDPVKDGYTFAGWHKDTACTQPWDFETGIPGDMTLYAKWTAIEATPTATGTATATAVTTPQPTATQTTAAATSVPQATTAAAVSPTLVQTPAPVAGALLGLLAAGLLLRRRLQ